ncbi:hypothetical protein MPSEU_000519100 [Mayamaea pseudoterrestris]|nr:hypothetical protein MPSEU_000519100 [Mayamaea pseudoterrestris]
MVLTKLHDMVSSVSDWTHGKRQVNASMKPSNSTASRAETSSEVFRHASNDSYWKYANDKIKGAAEDAYSSIADMVSNALYTDGSVNLFGSKSFRSTKRNWDSYLSATQDDFYSARLSNLETPRRSALKRSSSISARELAIMFKNPYEHVRGRHSHQSSSSVSAIRSLLTLVPQTMSHPQSSYHLVRSTSADGVQAYNDMDDSWTATCTPHKDNRINDLPANVHPPFVSSAETASQIAEGTVRALRDLALDEAVELHNSLRFWSERWERPLLSWLEAGPGVWMRPGGYNHQAVGRKVAQIQAILARRCASIGELQTHLLRAGWHKGVAQWGVLGDGGQWAAVSGFDGFTADAEKHQDAGRSRTRTLSNVDVTVSQKTKASKDEFAIAETSGRQALPPTIESIFSGHSEANIFVQKFAGGGLVVDDPAFLSEWSVIGIKLVRQQLSRSMGGAEHLPYDNHWTSSSSHDREDFFVPAAKSSAIPCWASVTTSPVGLTEGPNDEHTEVIVIDLPAMIVEVSELVEVMEPIMNMQRRRRLDKLQPPSWIRRNWFVMASAGPVISYLGYQLLRNNNAKATYRQLTQKVRHFCRERIQEPIAAIIQELWKGRAPFSDREARLEAIESLKKMIRNWLGTLLFTLGTRSTFSF